MGKTRAQIKAFQRARKVGRLMKCSHIHGIAWSKPALAAIAELGALLNSRTRI